MMMDKNQNKNNTYGAGAAQALLPCLWAEPHGTLESLLCSTECMDGPHATVLCLSIPLL